MHILFSPPCDENVFFWLKLKCYVVRYMNRITSIVPTFEKVKIVLWVPIQLAVSKIGNCDGELKLKMQYVFVWW